ncbi:MAG: AtaL-like protein [Bacteroidota bacterium]
MISYNAIVNVPIEKVWEHFLLKIEQPQHFIPGVSNVKIVETHKDYVIREMDLKTPQGDSIRLKEKITFSPYWVKFLILDHPIYEGYVDNLAESISENKTAITYTLSWINKETREVFKQQEMIQNAVLKTVDYILQNQ